MSKSVARRLCFTPSFTANPTPADREIFRAAMERGMTLSLMLTAGAFEAHDLWVAARMKAEVALKD